MMTPEEIQTAENTDNSVDYKWKLEDINNNIRALTNEYPTDDMYAKENLNLLLNKEFLDGFVNSLNQDQKNWLKWEVKNLLDSHKTDENFQVEYKGLIALAGALGVEWYENKWDDGTVDGWGDNDALDKWNNGTLDVQQGVKLNWGISEGVTKLQEWQTTEWHFYVDGKRAEEPTWVGELKSGVNTIIGKIEESKFKDKEELVTMKTSLENIQKILENPTDANVQILQSYIYENLDEDKKEEFRNKNKFDGTNFDWKFWVSTKSGLDDLLTKMDDYIKSLENQEQQDQQEQQEQQDQQEQQEQQDQQDQPIDTTPLNIGNDKYLVMKDSSDLAKKTGLDWVTFYSTIIDSTSNVDWNWNEEQPQLSENTNVKDGDNEYYVKFPSNPDATYRVKVANWELCPIATEISDKLNYKDWSDVETQVLLKNNESCVRYLENKLPDSIKNDVTIRWNSESQDYVLDSFWWELTIEPMTIAWDWISKKEDNNPDYLMKSLAFLNLTNYIRSEWKSRGKNNPDVNKELKIKWIKDKQNWNKLYIDRERFWLENATSKELSRYKKYNNHEKWDDDWDKKKENRFYKKIDVK